MLTKFEELAQPMSREKQQSESLPPTSKPKPQTSTVPTEFERLATQPTQQTSVEPPKIKKSSKRKRNRSKPKSQPQPVEKKPMAEEPKQVKTKTGVIDTEKAQTREATEFERLATREIARRESQQTPARKPTQNIEQRALKSTAEGKKELIFFETTEEGTKKPITVIEKKEPVKAITVGDKTNKQKEFSKTDETSEGIPVDSGEDKTFLQKTKTKSKETLGQVKTFLGGTKQQVKEKGATESFREVDRSFGDTLKGFAGSFVKGAVKLTQTQHFGEDLEQSTPLTDKLGIKIFKKTGKIAKGFVTTDPLSDPDVHTVATVGAFAVAAEVLPATIFGVGATAVIGASAVQKIKTTPKGEELKTVGSIGAEATLLAVPLIARAKSIPFLKGETKTSDITLSFEPKTQTAKGTGSKIPKGKQTADIILEYSTTSKRFGKVQESITTVRLTPEGGIKQKTVGKGFLEKITQEPKSDVATLELFKLGKLVSSRKIKGADQSQTLNLDSTLRAKKVETVAEITDPSSGRKIIQTQDTTVKGKVSTELGEGKVLKGEIDQSLSVVRRDFQPRAKVSTKDIIVDKTTKQVGTTKKTIEEPIFNTETNIREVPLTKTTEDVILKIVERPKPQENIITQSKTPKVEQVFLNEKGTTVQTSQAVKEIDIPLVKTKASRRETISGTFKIEDTPKPKNIFVKISDTLKSGTNKVIQPLNKQFTKRSLSKQIDKSVKNQKVVTGENVIQEVIGKETKTVEVPKLQSEKPTEINVPKDLLGGKSTTQQTNKAIIITAPTDNKSEFIPLEQTSNINLVGDSKIIPISRDKSDTIIKVESLQNQESKLSTELKSVSETRQKTELNVEQRSRQNTDLKIEQNLKQESKLETELKVEQNIEQLEQSQEIDLRSDFRGNLQQTNINVPPTGFFNFRKESSVDEALFNVQVGKEKNVFFFERQDLTETQLKEFVKSKVLGTAAASFKIQPANIQAKEKISGVESSFSKLFQRSKKSPERFVQAREERISSEGEKFDITFKGIAARRSKLKRKSILGFF